MDKLFADLGHFSKVEWHEEIREMNKRIVENKLTQNGMRILNLETDEDRLYEGCFVTAEKNGRLYYFEAHASGGHEYYPDRFYYHLVKMEDDGKTFDLSHYISNGDDFAERIKIYTKPFSEIKSKEEEENEKLLFAISLIRESFKDYPGYSERVEVGIKYDPIEIKVDGFLKATKEYNNAITLKTGNQRFNFNFAIEKNEAVRNWRSIFSGILYKIWQKTFWAGSKRLDEAAVNMHDVYALIDSHNGSLDERAMINFYENGEQGFAFRNALFGSMSRQIRVSGTTREYEVRLVVEHLNEKYEMTTALDKAMETLLTLKKKTEQNA